MSKKVLIIGTSPRKNGNSNRLAQEFEKGAREAGNDVDVVYLYDKNINFCKGCLACQKLNHCVIDDDANSITEKIHNAEVIVWATPVYYYEMCGQMKTMIDRSNPLYTMDNKFEDIYLLAAAAEPETSAFDGAIKGLQGWIDCHEKAHLKGVIRGLYKQTLIIRFKTPKDEINLKKKIYRAVNFGTEFVLLQVIFTVR